MDEPKKAPETRLNPETKVAQDIFARERGVNRDMPLTEFLTNVEKETRDRLREARGKARADLPTSQKTTKN